MNVPRQRRNDSPVPRRRVGSLASGGVLSTGFHPGVVWVNVFVGAGVTADVSPEDAEAFAYALLDQARHARHAR